jgi:hypothetical protein
MKILDLIACAVVAASCLASPLRAQGFTCTDLSLTRTAPTASQPSRHRFSADATLHLALDKAEPSRSVMEWSGDPTMEGVTSNWPKGTQLTIQTGIIAASFLGSRKAISSVGTFTLDRVGRLRVTESTLLPQGVLFDVVEGNCHDVQK